MQKFKDGLAAFLVGAFIGQVIVNVYLGVQIRKIQTANMLVEHTAIRLVERVLDLEEVINGTHP